MNNLNQNEQAKNSQQPKIKLSLSALRQLKLILQNDFLLKEKHLRIEIIGKGCDGFSYAIGFSDKRPNDVCIELDLKEYTHQMVMGSFEAFYLQDCTVDYVQNWEEEQEGFIVINHRQKEFSGKFWLKDPTKIPPSNNQEKV